MCYWFSTNRIFLLFQIFLQKHLYWLFHGRIGLEGTLSNITYFSTYCSFVVGNTAWLDVLCRHTKKSTCRETKRATKALNILTDKKLSARCIHWWCAKIIFSFFESYSYVKLDKTYPNFFARHSWMCLAKNSNAEVLGSSDCCVFARKSISLVKICVDRDWSKY